MAQAVWGRARRCVRRPKKWAAKNSEDRCKCGQSTNLGVLRSKIRCESNSRRIEYEWGNSATDCKWRFGNEKFFHENGASNLDTWQETTSGSHFNWSKNSITKMNHPTLFTWLSPLRVLAIPKTEKCPEGTKISWLFWHPTQRENVIFLNSWFSVLSRPRWKEVAVPVLWPIPQVAVTVFSAPDDGCYDARNM